MTKPDYIVAIGASAGGLAPLQQFFEHTEIDGIAFVLILRLSSDSKDNLNNSLSTHPTLGLVHATEGILLEANKIYLIPEDQLMGIKDGRFIPLIEENALSPMTIDAFFISLAIEIGTKAIGIILSGIGNDGAEGAIAIENTGGVVMVQDPVSAQFKGKPQAVLKVSNTNLLLAAKDFPAAIQQHIASHRLIRVPKKKNLEQQSIVEITHLIKANYPYDFTEYKNGTLQRRIERRMLHHDIQDVKNFITYLQQHPEEIEILISDFLIGVTSFFRDPEAFHILEKEIIPRIISAKSENELVKVWVACCATGEEAYSIAIMIKEYLDVQQVSLNVKIFATDINETALKQAGSGIFPLNVAKAMSKERLEKYFEREADSYKIKSEIRELLIFARHDLSKNPPYCHVDLISCRNMLIYIKPQLQKQILSKLAFGLNTNGFLFLGSSEHLTIDKNNFTEISSKWKIYQYTGTRKLTNLDTEFKTPLSGLSGNTETKSAVPTASGSLIPNEDIHALMRLETGFTGLIIDKHGTVIESYGDLGPYLKQERFKYRLQELLPDNLDLAVNAALKDLLSSNARKSIKNIPYPDPSTGSSSAADIVVSSYHDQQTNSTRFLVIFRPSDYIRLQEVGTEFQMDTQTKAYILQLETELLGVKQNLSASNEYLETSREAMQAFNEELLSANEEMQSANEELQSINEELETVNAAHKNTINELTDLNDDLNNYFRSNVNGQLFVDKNIHLKKYSPGVVEHINIRENDIGRPLNNITTNIKLETIQEDIKKVLEFGEIITREVESKAGGIYQVMTSPYLKSGSDETSGAIVTFYDITALKKTQHEIMKSMEMFRLATVASEMGTWSIDIHHRKLFCSARLNEIFGHLPSHKLTYSEVVQQIEKSHQTSFLKSLDEAIRDDKKLEIDFPLKRNGDQLSRWVRLIGNLSSDHSGAAENFTGIMYDITDRKLDDLRKNDFIAIVSHELKSPLTSILGYLQLLTKQALKADNTFAIGALEKTINQVKKMHTLINGFLNVSRLEAGKIYLNRHTFEIDKLNQEIVQDILNLYPLSVIEIKNECKLTMHADRDKIGQVIYNLLSNAIKYSPNGGRISITCNSDQDGSVQVNIHDLGMGIDKKEMDRVFDRYFRIENMDKSMISGFGIGLYLCKEIVHSHKGKIWAESDYGKGSTFSFAIPVDKQIVFN